jgi:hypothetical protein
MQIYKLQFTTKYDQIATSKFFNHNRYITEKYQISPLSKLTSYIKYYSL